jgi:pyruvate dehydrogenase complex dehydrogenase (E1) component
MAVRTTAPLRLDPERPEYHRAALGWRPGAVALEATAAFAELRSEEPGAGLLAITSPDRLHAEWLASARKARAGFGAPSL